MPYIQPNSTIYLYNNIELDNSYKDTLYFSGIEEQNQYFNVTKPWKYAFIQQMYQRTNKGTLRIEKNAEFLYDCNYLRFNNPRTVDSVTQAKWYYAFITNWEYINENVTEITYEIDIMQTYFFDVIIEPSFVVRQHSTTDNKYEHLIEESLNIGSDYIVSDGTKAVNLDLDSIMVISTQAGLSGPGQQAGTTVGMPIPTIINNMLCPLAVAVFMPTPGETLLDVQQKFIKHFSETAAGGTTYKESIVSAFLVPQRIANLVPSGATTPESDYTEGVTPVIGVDPSQLTLLESTVGGADLLFGSYAPHNYKLYCYPYSYLNVSNHQGDSVDYKYEMFTFEESPAFDVNFAAIPTPSVMLSPRNYRRLEIDYDSSLLISDFPTMPVTIDGFQQWLTHNSGKMTASVISSVLSLMAGIGTFGLTPVIGTFKVGPYGKDWSGVTDAATYYTSKATGEYPQWKPSKIGEMGLMRAGQGAIRDLSGFGSNVASIIGEYNDARKLPAGVKSNLTGNSLLQGLDLYEFRFYKMQIKEEQARKIDTFFDMFGYAENKVMDVNRNSRPVFNYVKTEGCCIIQNQVGNSSSGATAQVINDMQRIYDNGITFWKPYSGFNIGDYSWNCRDANSLHPQTVTP